MAGDAVQFAQDDPHVLRPFRHSQTHQFFNGGAVDQLIIEIGQVIHPVEKGNDLVKLLPFAQFLRTPVQVADVGLHVGDLLTVNPEHHAKNPVGGRVLRAHVKQHLHGFTPGNYSSWDIGHRLTFSKFLVSSILIVGLKSSLGSFHASPFDKGGWEISVPNPHIRCWSPFYKRGSGGLPGINPSSPSSNPDSLSSITILGSRAGITASLTQRSPSS